MKVIKLDIGWKDLDFQEELQKTIDEQEKLGFMYYDIKISSTDSDCLVIFKEEENKAMMESRG